MPHQYIGKVDQFGALRKSPHIHHRLGFDGMGPCCLTWLHSLLKFAVHGPAIAPFLIDNGLPLDDGLCIIKGPLHNTIWSLAARCSGANRCWCHRSGTLNGNKAYLLHNFNDVVVCHRHCRAFFGATVIAKPRRQFRNACLPKASGLA